MSDAVAIAQSLMRCASVTPEDAGVMGVLQGWLKPLGFACHALEFTEPGSYVAHNMFARIGTGGPHFCFAGHTDVVPVGDAGAWKHDPFAAELEDGYLWGRGAEDMKGAIGCFIAAAAQFLTARPAFGGSISLLIAADEEGFAVNGTKKCLRWMHEHGHVPDVCVVGEPTNPETIGDMVKIGRRGSMTATLTVRGRQGHVAYPQLADNPVTRIIHILHALKSHSLDTGTAFFPPSNLEIVTVDVGNPAVNVIPAEARAKFNIRYNDLHTSQQLSEWIHAACRTHAADYTLEIKVTGEPFLTQPGALSALAAEAVKDATGRTPELSTTGGTSDARFIKDYCPVVEFGTTNKTAHMVNERVKLDDLETLMRCYLRMLERFFG